MGISKKTCQTPNNNCNLTSRAHQKQLWCLLVLKMACVAHCSPCTLQLSHRVSVLNLSWCCQPHFALHSCSLMLVHGPPTLCLDEWRWALQTGATPLLLWGLRGLSGAVHYPLFPLLPRSPPPLLRKPVLGCGQPNIFMWDWTRKLAVNASHNIALGDLFIDLEMLEKLRNLDF